MRPWLWPHVMLAHAVPLVSGAMLFCTRVRWHLPAELTVRIDPSAQSSYHSFVPWDPDQFHEQQEQLRIRNSETEPPPLPKSPLIIFLYQEIKHEVAAAYRNRRRGSRRTYDDRGDGDGGGVFGFLFGGDGDGDGGE
jgi:hypothetical protein